VNNLPKTVTRQRRDCDLNPGPTAPESSMLTTRLPSQPEGLSEIYRTTYKRCVAVSWRVDDVVGHVTTIESASATPARLDLGCLATVERVNKARRQAAHRRRTEDLVISDASELRHLYSDIRQNVITLNTMPSVLSRCWLGGRKGIQPVKI